MPINNYEKPTTVFNTDGTITRTEPKGARLPEGVQQSINTNKARRMQNIEQQRARVEEEVVNVIDYRILRKSGGLKV